MISLLMSVALAGEIEAESRVEAVTVYSDRARITRTATVELPSGRSEILFDGLSLQLLQDSLSAEGTGNARAVLTGIDVVTKRGTEDRDEAVRALQKEKQGYTDKVAVHKDTVARVDGEIAFLNGLKPVAPAELDDATFLADDAPEQLAKLTRNMGEDLRALYAEKRAANLVMRDLNKEISRITRELQQLTRGGGEDHRTVSVGVDVSRAGKFTVELTYVATGASWTPRYDARYSLSNHNVRLDLSGQVTQRTGEDWENVALTLSTAQPQRSTQPPELQPFTLRDGGPSARSSSGSASSNKVTAFEFTAKRSEDVPADGTKRRVPLHSSTLEADVVHKIVPRRQQVAYMVARIAYDGEFALLPGPISAYLGNAYVGQGKMSLTPPGGELDLSFGVDDRVGVERKRLEDVAQDAAALSNRERRTWAFETTVENHTGKSIDVVLVEQSPASRDAKWEVKTTLTPEAKIPADGVFEWKESIAEGGKQVFRLDYEVSWPEGQRPLLMD